MEISVAVFDEKNRKCGASWRQTLGEEHGSIIAPQKLFTGSKNDFGFERFPRGSKLSLDELGWAGLGLAWLLLGGGQCHARPSQAMPRQARASQTKPRQATAGHAKPQQSTASQTKPRQAQPSQSQVKQENSEPTSQAKPSGAKPSLAESSRRNPS